MPAHATVVLLVDTARRTVGPDSTKQRTLKVDDDFIGALAGWREVSATDSGAVGNGKQTDWHGGGCVVTHP